MIWDTIKEISINDQGRIISIKGMGTAKDFKKNDEDKKKCNHKFVYNRIIDELRKKVNYVITCEKCFYEPPEGYVEDSRCVLVNHNGQPIAAFKEDANFDIKEGQLLGRGFFSCGCLVVKK